MDTSTLTSPQEADLVHSVRTFWRKKYAADAGLDAKQEEEAFCRIAFNDIQRKAGALNDPEHRLGFEVVYRNEEGSRMVGLFAFRSGDNIMFIPAMYLNGEVKGTDLLYRANTKTIVPVDKKWIQYVISEGRKDEGGRGISRSESNKISPDLNLHLLAKPQNHASKKASDRKAEYEKGWEAVKAAMAESPELEKHLLRKFLSSEPTLAKKAFDRIVAELNNNRLFAAGFDLCCDRRDLAVPHVTLSEKNAAPVRPPLVLHMGLGGIKNASEADLNRNYWVEDNREKHAAAHEPMHEHLQAVQPTYEVCQIACHDGSYVKALVGARNNGRDYAPGVEDGEDRKRVRDDQKHSRHGSYFVLALDSGKLQPMTELPAGVCTGDTPSGGVDVPESGKTYTIVSKKNTSMTYPIEVDEVVTRSDGVVLLSTRDGELVLNPDMETSRPHDGVYAAKDTVFYPVAMNSDVDYDTWEHAPMTHYEAVDALAKCASEKVKVTRHSGEYLVDMGIHQINGLSKMAALMYLTGSMGLKHEDGERIVKTAEAAGETSFLWEPINAEEIVKEARRFLLPEPPPPDDWDAVHNVPIGEDREYVINTDYTNTTHEPTPRYGDAMDPGAKLPGVVDASIVSMSPTEIEILVNETEMPEVFEHGVIGSLVNTFDGVHVAERYLKDLEKAVDRIGRWLFLFYWKPQDFEQSYGSDKMEEMEDAMLSVFKSLGEVTIDLKLQSTDAQDRGSPQEG